MDIRIFYIINEFAHKNAFVDALGVFFALYALPLLFLCIIVLGLKNRRLLIQGMASGALAYGINAIIGTIIVRHRPFVDHTVIQLIHKSATSKSFPSDHAALAFAVAGVLSFFYPKWSLGIFTVALLIAVSRVFVGVHYPTDIVAGAAVGVVSAFAVLRLLSTRSNTH